MITLMLLACAPPDPNELFVVVESTASFDAEATSAAFIAVADEAKTHLAVALPGLTDPALTDALIAAADRGVTVEVAVDWDRSADAGVALLQEADVPVTLADGPVTFFDFDLTTEVSWTSQQVKMTHAFVVADRRRWAIATRAGDLAPGPIALFDGRGEDVGEVLWLEHNQVFGGNDATAATAFNGLAKSIPDIRFLFPTQDDELMNVHFGPQERLTKSLIDAVYSARSSVRVMAEDIADEGFARALQQKAADGFDVEVIVGGAFGSEIAGLSAILADQTPDVTKLQGTEPTVLPTLLFVDFDRARNDQFYQPRVLAVTHPIYSAGRVWNDNTVTTDQLIDGTLVIYGMQGEPSAPLQALADLYRDVRATAEAL
jgi:hypothetical protein